MVRASDLHNRYNQTPPAITEWTFSPKRLRAVDIAERDHHCRKKKKRAGFRQHLTFKWWRKTDALKASLPMCKARNPAITFWVSSRPFDSSPNHWGAFADELHSQKTKINQRQRTCDGSKHQVSTSPTWPWICESRWRWCCQLKWSCFSLGRLPAAWSQRPTGRH